MRGVDVFAFLFVVAPFAVVSVAFVAVVAFVFVRSWCWESGLRVFVR